MNIPLQPAGAQDPQARIRLPFVQRPARQARTAASRDGIPRSSTAPITASAAATASPAPVPGPSPATMSAAATAKTSPNVAVRRAIRSMAWAGRPAAAAAATTS